MSVRGPKWHGLLAVLAIAGLQPAALAAGGDTSIESPQQAAYWTQSAARELLAVIEDADKEGLHPADYGLAGLKQALVEGEGATLDARATAAALALARDYYLGRVIDRSDMQWMIERSPYEALQLPSQLQKAIDDGKLRDFFDALLPSDPRYRALRTELAETPAGPTRDRLRVNMERWRWMPRSMASSYLYVNVPSYRLQLVQDGVQLSSYDVIVGARDTPTPQMVSPTGSLVVNPSWYVPQSIVRKSGLRPGRGGYVWKAVGDGSYRVVQPPGPRNALGRIKFNLDNDQAIYLHDTNIKAAFERENRALSHGCIRVKDIDQLAFELMNRGGNESALDEALASSQTATLRLPQTWPVYIVYFTADTDDSGAVVTYGDPYHYDAKVLAGLDGPPVQIASSSSGA